MHPLWDIEHVIPHRGTLRLIDRLLGWDEDSVRVELQIPDDSPFHNADGVPSYVGIEYMAQAIAAWAGCHARARGDAPPIGFLLGTRRYQCVDETFAPGRRLQVQAQRELMGDNGLGVFACCISDAGRELATAHVSVYEPPDAQAYLESENQ